MLLTDFTEDLIIYMAKYMSYSKCLLLVKSSKKFKNSNFLFTNCELFSSHRLGRALEFHQLMPIDLLDILRHSSINVTQSYSLLQNIHKDLTDFNYVLTYNCKYVTPKNIHSTIQYIQILLTMLENSMQHTPLYIYLNDLLVDYFIDVIKNKFRRTTDDIHRVSHKFRMALYSNIWYKSNINMYAIFCLYMLNLCIIHYRFVEAILQFSDSHSIKSEHPLNDSILAYVFEFLELFNFNEFYVFMLIKMLSYIITANIKIRSVLIRQKIEGLYADIMSSTAISENVKDKLTDAINSWTLLL